MKIVKWFLAAAGVAAGVGGAAYQTAPDFRVAVDQQLTQWRAWTTEARQRDPVGFADYASGQLQRDLAELTQARGALIPELDKLDKAIREQQALLAYADELADEFRQASLDAVYPVTVRGAAYTEADVVRQVSLVLAEAEGYKTSVQRLEGIRQQTQQKFEELTVRVNQTEAQLVALSTQRELLRARQQSEAGEQLVAQVDDLMQGNRRAIATVSVRSVQELLAAEQPQPEAPTLAAARKYLAEGKPAGAARSVQEIQPVSFDEPVADGPAVVPEEVNKPMAPAAADEPAIKKPHRAKVRGKRIFEQR